MKSICEHIFHKTNTPMVAIKTIAPTKSETLVTDGTAKLSGSRPNLYVIIAVPYPTILEIVVASIPDISETKITKKLDGPER